MLLSNITLSFRRIIPVPIHLLVCRRASTVTPSCNERSIDNEKKAHATFYENNLEFHLSRGGVSTGTPRKLSVSYSQRNTPPSHERARDWLYTHTTLVGLRKALRLLQRHTGVGSRDLHAYFEDLAAAQTFVLNAVTRTKRLVELGLCGESHATSSSCTIQGNPCHHQKGRNASSAFFCDDAMISNPSSRYARTADPAATMNERRIKRSKCFMLDKNILEMELLAGHW